MAIQYKNPIGGTPSSIGTQINEQYYYKKAIIDVKDDIVFGKLSDSVKMPKHYGKTIIVYHYIPLIDDRNINDQGLDAAGASYANGNLYGSSRDIGNVTNKMPVLGEQSGKVNRVGFTRETLTANIKELGFYFEYTKDSLQFDTDSDLLEHLTREALRGAIRIYEDTLCTDLLNGAGVIRYCGDAVSNNTTTGETGDTKSEITYATLAAVSKILDTNRTPKSTKIIQGTRLIDTKTVAAARWMFIGPELIQTFERMVDYHNLPAFVPVEQYAAGTTVHQNEIGKVKEFRIVVVQEMLYYKSLGKAVTSNGGYIAEGGFYNIYPALVVGDESFVTIGFQGDGINQKFKTNHVKPEENVNSANNPYAKIGFQTIQWWYGTLILRPERIALIKSVART